MNSQPNWTEESISELKGKCAGNYAHYLKTIFNKEINDFLADTNNAIILKTDLFTEAIDTRRDTFPTLKQANNIIYGIDINKNIVKEAKRLHPKDHFQVGDIKKLNYKNDAFTHILDVSTIDHEPITNVPSILNEYARTLQSKGKLFLLFWNSNNIGIKILSKIGDILKGKEQHFNKNGYLFDDKQMSRMLKEKGFDVLKRKRLGFFMYFESDQFEKYLAKKTIKRNNILIWIERHIPFIMSMSPFTLIIAKKHE